jgi:hypothetical protein
MVWMRKWIHAVQQTYAMTSAKFSNSADGDRQVLTVK